MDCGNVEEAQNEKKQPSGHWSLDMTEVIAIQ